MLRVILAATLITAPTLRAQLVNDGATATLANVTNTLTGTVTVGTNGSFTLLTLADNALLTNSLHGIIGLNATARSNEVRLVSPTARWQMGGDLAVGISGSFSRFVVSNGARAENNLGSLAPNGQSSNNLALVTGSGSLWSNRTDLIVGWFGRNNELLVSDGGRVVNVAGGTIGSQASAPGNVATVTGSGSIWNAGSALTVGYLGANNRLVVEAGGRVDCGTGRVGYNTGSNNLALVTGAGSTWSNVSLELGGFGRNNQLIVSNGATVVSSVDGYFGHDPGASNNVAVVTGAGSLWTIGDGLLVGYQEGRNQLVVSNGAVVADRIGHLGYFSIANNNTAVVTGAGSVWSNRLNLIVGLDGAGNRLDVSNGAAVVADVDGFLGFNPGASNNVALVTGTSSGWTSDGLYVGYQEGRNQLVVSNGAVVADRVGLLGYFSSANNNTAVVTGSGSVWSNRAGIFVGVSGSANQMIVSNGAMVFSSASVVGVDTNSTGNVALVTGAGSVWHNAGLTVGAGGPLNRLEVREGGSVLTTGSGIIGAARDNFSNSVLVADAGSQWLLSSNLLIGTTNDSCNQLVISNGAMVANHEGMIGLGLNAGDNTVTVRGSSSLWSNRSVLILGDRSVRNRLFISDGGRVVSSTALIGLGQFGSTSPSGNLVTVAGVGSSWSDSSSIVVGRYGNFNGLVVTNGGLVTAAGGVTLGEDDQDNDNFVTVTGPGSELRLSGEIDFRGGHSLRLLVLDGGRVVGGGGTLGRRRTSNSAIVAGPGSTWTNSGRLTVGDNNNAQNTLLAVTNGGSVFATAVTIGGGTATGSRVVVEGGTLRVANTTGSGTLTVVAGSSNVLTAGTVDVDRLNLTFPGGQFFFNGGTLITRGGLIDNGTPWVVGTNTGTPRRWQIDAGPGDLVVRGGVIVGASLFSGNNLVQFNGGTLRLSNATSSSVFDLRRGTNQLNAGVMEVDQLLVTNASGVFQHNGGSLRPRSTTFSNGSVFTVGNGASAASLQLLGGTHTFANNLVIAGNATFGGSGNVVVGSVTNFGAISPGASAGSLRINGDLRLQSSSVLAFELGGLTPTNQHDQLTVTNFAELAGTLSLSLINNFYPAPTNSITLMRFASFSGTLANVPLAGARVNTADNLASFFVSYTPSSVVIGGVQYVDSDGDGMSDIQELLAGTNPNDPNSVLRITSIVKDALGRYAIQFQSVNGENYRVEYSSDLAAWQVVSGHTFTSAGNDPHGHPLTQWIDDGTLTGGLPFTKRAYRIRLQ